MSERVAIVTGASAGLGLWTARHLAPHVDRLALVCRDRDRAQRAREFVKREMPGMTSVDCWLADVSSIASVRAVAAGIRAAYGHVSVLVNNAGAVFARRQLSMDGIEMHLATNYVGHFVLTSLLLELLAGASEARVVNLTSPLHAVGRVRCDDLGYTRWYHLVPAYAQSKLALVLFTRELARRTRHLPLTVNCVDPGFVRTAITRGAGPIQRQFAWPMNVFAKEPEEGARAIASLAVDPAFKGCSGEYFVGTRRRLPGRRGRDAEAAARLWNCSEEWLQGEERAALSVLLRGIAPRPAKASG